MTNFTIKVQPDQGNNGTNMIDLHLKTRPMQELNVRPVRGESNALPGQGGNSDTADQELRVAQTMLYYATERIAQLEARVKRLEPSIPSFSLKETCTMLGALSYYKRNTDIAFREEAAYTKGGRALSNEDIELLFERINAEG